MTIERAQSPQPVDPRDPNPIARGLYAENLAHRDELTEGGEGSRALGRGGQIL